MKIVLALLGLVAVAASIELDNSNFEDGIAGKAAFIKFLAPW
jgi:hypothetical protein